VCVRVCVLRLCSYWEHSALCVAGVCAGVCAAFVFLLGTLCIVYGGCVCCICVFLLNRDPAGNTLWCVRVCVVVCVFGFYLTR